jgi:hypothetical protein
MTRLHADDAREVGRQLPYLLELIDSGAITATLDQRGFLTGAAVVAEGVGGVSRTPPMWDTRPDGDGGDMSRIREVPNGPPRALGYILVTSESL